MKTRHKHLILIASLFIILGFFFYKPWIIGDGMEYYSYVRSVVIDHDLNFTDEYTYLATLNQGGEFENYLHLTVTGLPQNPAPIGTAILWTPAFVFAHSISILFGMPANGYTQLYFTLVTLTTVLFAFLGVVLIYFFLQKFFDAFTSLIATLTLWLASGLFYYTFNDPSMSHVFSMFCVTLFIYLWYNNISEVSLYKHWMDFVFIGLTAGLVFLVRWQDAIFLILLIFPIVRSVKEKGLYPELKKFSIIILAFFVTIIPQFIVWKIIYGKYLTIPQGSSFIIWWPKYLPNLLFSPVHGLFTWTPVLIISFIGFYWLYRERRDIAVPLLIALLLQLYFNSSITDWHGSWSFGARRLLDSVLIFALGLGFLINRMPDIIRKYVAYPILGLLIAWNILLVVQIHYNHYLLDPAISLSILFNAQIADAPKLFWQLILSKLGLA